jgi:GNAT superfamily N-acetyltransferase
LEVRRDDGYVISTDKSRLDVDFIHRYIAEESYWARGRSREVQERAIANSLCFGLYCDGQQVGFARVVSDCATFGWLCDVFVDEAQRGRGLGKWLIETVVAHPDVAPIRRLMLATRDAHELYRRYGGFDMLSNPERWMTRQRE